jgi:Putative zinc ribbon domain
MKKVEERKEMAKSQTYCSHCYADGEFTAPNLTVEQMRERVKDKLIEFGIPRFLTRLFTRNIHKLERWKNQ